MTLFRVEVATMVALTCLLLTPTLYFNHEMSPSGPDAPITRSANPAIPQLSEVIWNQSVSRGSDRHSGIIPPLSGNNPTDSTIINSSSERLTPSSVEEYPSTYPSLDDGPVSLSHIEVDEEIQLKNPSNSTTLIRWYQLNITRNLTYNVTITSSQVLSQLFDFYTASFQELELDQLVILPKEQSYFLGNLSGIYYLRINVPPQYSISFVVQEFNRYLPGFDPDQAVDIDLESRYELSDTSKLFRVNFTGVANRYLSLNMTSFLDVSTYPLRNEFGSRQLTAFDYRIYLDKGQFSSFAMISQISELSGTYYISADEYNVDQVLSFPKSDSLSEPLLVAKKFSQNLKNQSIGWTVERADFTSRVFSDKSINITFSNFMPKAIPSGTNLGDLEGLVYGVQANYKSAQLLDRNIDIDDLIVPIQTVYENSTRVRPRISLFTEDSITAYHTSGNTSTYSIFDGSSLYHSQWDSVTGIVNQQVSTTHQIYQSFSKDPEIQPPLEWNYHAFDSSYSWDMGQIDLVNTPYEFLNNYESLQFRFTPGIEDLNLFTADKFRIHNFIQIRAGDNVLRFINQRDEIEMFYLFAVPVNVEIHGTSSSIFNQLAEIDGRLLKLSQVQHFTSIVNQTGYYEIYDTTSSEMGYIRYDQTTGILNNWQFSGQKVIVDIKHTQLTTTSITKVQSHITTRSAEQFTSEAPPLRLTYPPVLLYVLVILCIVRYPRYLFGFSGSDQA